MNKDILFYGVPGVGKTYITRSLSSDLNLPLIELDSLREPLQQGKDISNYPFLFYGTTEAYKFFGEPTKENIIKGLISVRKAMESAIKQTLDNQRSKFIAEGAFLNPAYAMGYGDVILLVQEDENKHRIQFFENREDTEDNNKSFVVSRLLQEYLIEESVKLGIPKFSSMDLVEIKKYIQD